MAQSRVPRFEDFPVSSDWKGPSARPLFVRQELLPDGDDRYRGSVALDVEAGPNFAGRYTIARWSCGTDCISMIVVDAKTGALYRSVPFGELVTSGNPDSKDHRYAGLSFRTNSRLLVVEGCFDPDTKDPVGRINCNRSYYVWRADRFQRLDSIPLDTPPWYRR